MTGAENTADITMVYAESAEKAPEFVQIRPNSRFTENVERSMIIIIDFSVVTVVKIVDIYRTKNHLIYVKVVQVK